MTSSSRSCEGSKLLNKHKGNSLDHWKFSQIYRMTLTWRECSWLLQACLPFYLKSFHFTSRSSPLCLHFFRGTPDPKSSVWKQLICITFSTMVKSDHRVQASQIEVTLQRPDWRLFRQQESEIMENDGKAKTVLENMRKLVKELFKEMNQPSTGNISVRKTLVTSFLNVQKMK